MAHLFSTRAGGGGSRSANSDRGLVLGVGGSRKTGTRARPRRDFFPDSGSDRDSDETFQISRNLGLELVEFVCLLDPQLWFYFHIDMDRNFVCLWRRHNCISPVIVLSLSALIS